MKLLYFVRLFSGLQTSLESGTWRPTGVPTVGKMIEALDRDEAEVTFVFASKDQYVDWPRRDDVTIELKGLGTPVRVLAGVARLPRFFRWLRRPLRDFAHALVLLRTYWRVRPDLVYVDHANVLGAALLSLSTRARIVFRVMGVYPAMRAALRGGRPAHRLLRFCYRRRYTIAICTQDGSGVEPWLKAALHPAVSCEILLNGLDRPDMPLAIGRFDDLPTDRSVVLFLGKIEPEKGALSFADGFLRAHASRPEALHALVVGSGGDLPELRRRFEAAGAGDRLTQIERMPHDEVMAAFARADIYVSLNRLGNLSNANLEAMSMGCCMVIPAPQPELGIDAALADMLPQDAAWTIGGADDTEGLAAALLRLHDDPAERLRRGAAVAAAIERHVPSWAQRIESELTLLRDLALPDAATKPAKPEPRESGV